MYLMILTIKDVNYDGVGKTENEALEQAKSKCSSLHEHNWFDIRLTCSYLYENSVDVRYVCSLGKYMIDTVDRD